MTSRNCSRKQQLYPFTSAFGAGLLLFNAALLLFVMLSLSFTQTSLTSFRMSNPHVLFILMMREPFEILCFLLTMQAVVTALLLFGFMLRKRVSVAYLSLPVSRSRLFWSRYAAGLLVLLVPMLIFISWQCYLNVQVFGSSPDLWKAFGWVTAGMAVILFTAYSLTVMICLCVGTIVEGVLFTGVAMIGALVLVMAIEFIMQTYLPGNMFGDQTGLPNMTSTQLAVYMPPFMPVFGCLLFTGELLRADIAAGIDIPFWGTWLNGAVTVAIWAVMSLIFSLLAFKAFLLYKAEQAGVLGVNQRINTVVSFIVVFFTFAALTAGTYATAPKRLLVGIVLSWIVFVVCRYLLTFNIQKTLRSMWQYGVMLAIISAVIVLFVTGMFGYSTWLPEADTVERATINYIGAPDFLRGTDAEADDNRDNRGISYETGSYFTDNNHANIYLRHFNNMWFTSKQDIQTVRMLHETLINEGLDFSFNRKQQITDPTKDRITLYVHVAYQLKNGKTVSRLYKQVTAQTALDLLALDDTDGIRLRINESLRPTLRPTLRSTDAALLPSITVSDPFFTNYIAFGPIEMEALFDALRTDVQHLSRAEKYFSDRPVKAVLSIERPREEINYNVFTYLFSTESGVNTVINANGEPFLDMFGPDTNTMRFYLTEAYTETLALLQKMRYFPGNTADHSVAADETKTDETKADETKTDETKADETKADETKAEMTEVGLSNVGLSDFDRMAVDITALYVERYAINPDFFTQALYFRAFTLKEYLPPAGAVSVSRENYGDLLSRTRSTYYMAEGGYLVRVQITIPDGNKQWVTFFLPEANAPDYVTE